MHASCLVRHAILCSLVAGAAVSTSTQGAGTVVCWGSNAFGKSNVPADLGPCTQVSSRGNHTVALVADMIPGDLDGNGFVTGADLGLLLAAWGACPNCAADLSGDGTVDGGDLGILLGFWTK